jgi:hypothetical protein
MRKSTHTRPLLEPLEEKALLSHVVPHHPVHVNRALPGPNHPVTINTTELLGSVSGTYSITPSTPAPGYNYSLTGSGKVGSLGTVQVTGFVHMGINAKSAPTGMITLSDSNGSLKISITGKGGPRPLAPAPVASNAMSLRYTIVSGTGAFRNFHGSGNLSFATQPITPVVTPPITPPVTTPPVTTPPVTTPPVTPPTPPTTLPPTMLPPTTLPPTTLPPTTLPPTTLPPTTLPPTTLPPTTLPPTTLPPTTLPPGGAGGGSPGHNAVTGAVGANARLNVHKNAHAIKALTVTGKPVGAPTFLHGEFILTFNGGTSNLPPVL